jgi:hypothetical protein
MVVGQTIECLICESEYFIRAGVGFDSYQAHHFDCLDCNQVISVAVRANAPSAHIEVVNNCKIIKFDYSKLVINLHPNCSFELEDYHNPRAFPTLTEMRFIMPHVRMIPGKIQSLSTQFDIPNAPKMWDLVKNINNLNLMSGKKKLTQKQIQNYSLQRKKVNPSLSHNTADEVTHEFLDAIFYPRVNNLSKPVIEKVKLLAEQNNLTEFFQYYQENLKSENHNRYFSTFTSYFKHRDVFGQLVNYSRTSNEGVDNKVVGSKDFDEIKLYYGEVYEALTSHFTILACLNNLLAGRKFDEFEKMSLNKYIKDVEKAKKHNPFVNVPEFSIFADDLDSSLRNGSHHASIWREGEIIMFKSGGTGAKRDISYSRYIHQCNKLTIALAAIQLVEIYIRKVCSLHVA